MNDNDSQATVADLEIAADSECVFRSAHTLVTKCLYDGAVDSTSSRTRHNVDMSLRHIGVPRGHAGIPGGPAGRPSCYASLEPRCSLV